MQVESNSRYNTYLRGWIATGYNDETGCWETASPDSETMRRYRSLFGTTIDPSETLMYSFYTAFDPDAIPSASERDYSTKTNSHTADGHDRMPSAGVYIRRVNGFKPRKVMVMGR